MTAKAWLESKAWPLLNHSKQSDGAWQTVTTDELLEAYTADIRKELEESNRLLELASKPEKALEEALTLAETWKKNATEAREQLKAQEWISPTEKLPEEDDRVLLAVLSEADDHSTGVTVRWPEVITGTIYSTPKQIIATTDDGSEYEDHEILGWKPLAAPPQGKGERATSLKTRGEQ